MPRSNVEFLLNDATKSFLKSAYKEYYFKYADAIEFPEAVQSREFGYIPFGGGMIRHLSFKSEGEALAEIFKHSPSSVYCSNAKYEYPTRPIEEKGWLGASLIFDIDATDIPTQCKKGHDTWYCGRCHHSGRLPKPSVCPKCQGSTAEFHGVCEICLEAAKEHTMRVIDFLTKDFGVPATQVTPYFSGNRGYHLHVSDERFELLDSQARGEVADYMRGGSLPSSQTLASSMRRGPAGGVHGDGWTRRITTYVEEKRSSHGGTLRKLVSESISSQRALVDSSVTGDIHRVFRLAGSLHGDTGMPKMRVMSFESFDPMKDPVMLSERPVKVKVDYYPRFRLKGMEFGPFKDETVDLPTFASIQIVARGLGEVA